MNRRTVLTTPGIACLLALTAASVVPFAQSASPVFEAADVHASPRRAESQLRPSFFLLSGRYNVRNATLVDLIATAYDISGDKVVGGPTWLEFDRFDIVAKLPAAGTDPRPMLKSLLADRFGLVAREAESDVPALALVVDGAPRLQSGRQSDDAAGCAVNFGRNLEVIAKCRRASIAALAEQLTRQNGGYFTTPIVDGTGLSGTWDIDLAWAQRGMLEGGNGQSRHPSLFQALATLGLKIDPQTMRAPAVLVQSANRTPTPNPPDVATTLAGGPQTFEVASIRLFPPDGNFSMSVAPNGQATFAGHTLRGLMTYAWDIPALDQLVSPPALDTTRFQVVARFDPIALSSIDHIRPHLRNLLEERFRVKTHTETRPIAVTVLTASNPRLTKAVPNRRTKCSRELPVSEIQRGVVGMRTLTCQNMTMAQFAEQLPIYGASTNRAIDETRLTGAWDFTISYGGQAAPSPAPATAVAPAAAEPSGRITFADALERQLGLKMTVEKRPGPVLVVDSADEKPTGD
jgi:uncharacterized protein (TIGR03435 family)